MDIKKAIEYAQVALKKVQKENAIQKRELTAKQLGEYMWQMYQCYDFDEIHYKAKDIVDHLELIQD